MAENLDPALKKIKKESFKTWSSTSTHNKVIEHRHTWTIDNYSSNSKVGIELKSPTFLAGRNGMEWRLELRPSLNNPSLNNRCTLQLMLVNCHLSYIKAYYTLGVVNANGEDVKLVSRSHNFKEKFLDCPCAYIPNSGILNEREEFLLDDILTIFCEITARVGNDSPSEALATPEIDLVKDIAYMLENKAWSDVTLSSCGKEFPAHKLILRARSPVFKAMFEHDKNNRVEITDIDDESLGEMLRYMYTGEAQNLKQIAPRLLKVADKYQMDGLKIMCEKALFKNLSHENAAETFIISEMYRAPELMNQVKDFIVAHAAEVGITPGFESMLKTHPHLVLEAFCACTK